MRDARWMDGWMVIIIFYVCSFFILFFFASFLLLFFFLPPSFSPALTSDLCLWSTVWRRKTFRTAQEIQWPWYNFSKTQAKHQTESVFCFFERREREDNPNPNQNRKTKKKKEKKTKVMTATTTSYVFMRLNICAFVRLWSVAIFSVSLRFL